MKRAGRLGYAFAAAALIVSTAAAAAEIYPNKPVRLVTSAAGGSADVTARLIAQGLTARLGQQVIVDNRGSGIIPGEIVARAKPDGYTLLFFGGTFWLQPLLRKNVPYDPIKDFAAITEATVSPTILAVHPALPAQTVRELIALAKAKPRELNYAMGSPGSANHLAAELFKAMAGVDMVGVGYKGNGPAVIGLITSQVQLMFATASSVIEHIKSGRLRGLAVCSAGPSAIAPDLPTMSASGLPGYESVSRNGLFAPAKTPRTIVDRLNRETVGYLATAEVKERFLVAGVEPVGGSPEELESRIKSEITRIEKVIRNSGIRAE